MKTTDTILIVEDVQADRDALSALLTSRGYRVLVAETGKAALSAASSHCPQLMLLNLGLPDIGGLDVLTAVREWSPMPVIIVSAQGHEARKVAALDLGADDYIVKPYGDAELMARVRCALRRPAPACMQTAANIVRVGGLAIETARHAVTVDGREVHLTPIEYRIIHLLALHAGHVFTHEHILQAFWGPHSHDPQILRVNMANIRRKIEPDPANPRYLITEVGVGYRMADEIEDGGKRG